MEKKRDTTSKSNSGDFLSIQRSLLDKMDKKKALYSSGSKTTPNVLVSEEISKVIPKKITSTNPTFSYEFENLIPKTCQKKYQLGDRLFSEFKYEDALETYKKSLECFEQYASYFMLIPRTEDENKIVSEYIYDISIKIKAISRIIDAKNKNNLRKEYKIEDLKKYSEEEWLELPLFDIIRISDAYSIPIPDETENLEDMKYRFYYDFTKKYIPELGNLRQIELIVQLMIMEKKYDDVLDFLNVSPEINNMIEAEVLKYIQKIELKRVQKFTNHLSDDIIYAINNCSFIFKLSSDQKKEIKKSLYELFILELQKLEFKTYKRTVYRTRKLEIDEIKKIITSLNVYIRQVVSKTSYKITDDEGCVYKKLTRAFFTNTMNNIDRMLNENKNYIPIIDKK